MKQRSILEQKIEVLKNLKTPQKVTCLMHQCNLNYQSLKKHLFDLSRNGFIQKTNTHLKYAKYYVITLDGLTLINLYFKLSLEINKIKT